jgi:hypothetical protein
MINAKGISMKNLFVVFMCFALTSAVAEDDIGELNVGGVEEVEEVVEVVDNSTKRWAAFGTFAYVDTWLPGKLGATASYGTDERVYEFAYQRASYSFDFVIDDLGKITDQRLHLTTRSFTYGGTFNYQYGLSYNTLKIKLGNAYTEFLSSNEDSLTVDTLNIVWGVGNRWKFGDNWQVGADWFKIFWPVLTVNENTDFIDDTNDADDEDDAQELVDTIKRVPTFTFVHFEVGYRF